MFMISFLRINIQVERFFVFIIGTLCVLSMGFLFSVHVSHADTCPTVTIDNSTYHLEPCSLTYDMVDGSGDQPFEFTIVQEGESAVYGFTVYGYGEGFPTYGITGVSSGGAQGNKTLALNFRDTYLNSEGNQPKVYSGYLPIQIYHGSWSPDYEELQFTITLTVNPGDNQAESSSGNTTTTSTPSVTTPNQNIITTAESLPKQDAFKAVVQIKTFTLDENYELAFVGQGSGVILDSSGLVLTNNHVVSVIDDFDGSYQEAAYQVCIPTTISSEPDCSYTAQLITTSNRSDLALLKIQNIPGLSALNTFSYLTLNQSDTTLVGDEITILGYPSIGDDTITVTKGIVSGKLEKYGDSWIKTDAVVSYGNSGGAAIDAAGGLVGVTSAAHADLVGSLGYIINTLSINSWFASSRYLSPQNSPLTQRVVNLTRRQHAVATSNTFTSDYPQFSVTKTQDWQFTYGRENALFIDNESDDEGGFVQVGALRLPYIATMANITPTITRLMARADIDGLSNIIVDEQITIHGVTGKKIVTSALGQTFTKFIFPQGEYLIIVAVNYGENDKDKTIVDAIVNSFTATPSATVVDEVRQYSHSSPVFALTASNGWYFMPQNSKETVLRMISKEYPKAYGGINLLKTDTTTKQFDNDQFLGYLTQLITQANQLKSSLIDKKINIVYTDTHYHLNDTFNDVIVMETENVTASTSRILSRTFNYYTKSGDVYMDVGMTVYGDDKAAYINAKQSFEKMIQQSFTSSSIPVTTSSQSTQQPTQSVTTPSGEVKTIRNRTLYNRLRGNILLKVEDNGKAYYVHPSSEKSYYLGRPADAFAVMREQGVGITNADLEKIPIGLKDLSGVDTDGDGLSDMFEDAVGTDKNKKDSDGDGFDDQTEVSSGYNPRGSGRPSYNTSFSQTHSGKIFLQVESRGEAWYINPNDGKRYFLGRPTDAFNVMRNLSLGISNKDFDELN